MTRWANLITGVLKIGAFLPAAARKRCEDRRYEDRRCNGRRRAKAEIADGGRTTCPGTQVPPEAGKGKKQTPHLSSRLMALCDGSS